MRFQLKIVHLKLCVELVFYVAFQYLLKIRKENNDNFSLKIFLKNNWRWRVTNYDTVIIFIFFPIWKDDDDQQINYSRLGFHLDVEHIEKNFKIWLAWLRKKLAEIKNFC